MTPEYGKTVTAIKIAGVWYTVYSMTINSHGTRFYNISDNPDVRVWKPCRMISAYRYA